MKKTPKVWMHNFAFSIGQCMIKCGKRGCRCTKGLMHGPYWYARFRTSNGHRTAKYLGKQLPQAIAELRDIAKNS
jgi:hypothetical protein